MQKINGYIRLARVDHWFKNVFCLPGIILAYYMTSFELHANLFLTIICGLFITCLTASANYTINEILDARYDKLHPEKHNRPFPSGQVKIPWAMLQYVLLSIISIVFAWFINTSFFFGIIVFWLMGLIYNVPPIRTKDLPYVDALSESINNPIRLLLGWWLIAPSAVAPLSILTAYWMLGAYFMSLKRYAEYRFINDPIRLSQYRKSFGHTNEKRLLLISVVYGNICCLMSGIFLCKFRVELIFAFPFIALLLGYYLAIAMKPNSPVQHPENLYKEKKLLFCILATVILFTILLSVDMPWLYNFFDVVRQ
ncbi:MAG: UbiA family prenyltransferase [Candidatus Omnitrophica bacterium]|nr:UbiA family prenyltransferase [Candidatus Omnitrophota bacterium]